MASLLSGANQSLGTLPNVDATPPQVVQISANQGMLLSFGRVFGSGSDALSEESDFAPFLIPALIEAVMSVLIILGEFDRKNEVEAWGHEADALDPQFVSFAQRYFGGCEAIALHEFLERHIVELDGAPSACFIVPADDEAQRSRARALLVLCSLLCRGRYAKIDVLKPHRHGMPYAELPKTVSAGWGWRDRFCDVHLLPREIADAVRLRITRQAEAQAFAS